MMRDMLRWSTTTGPKMRVRKESMLTIRKMDQMMVQDGGATSGFTSKSTYAWG